MEQSISENLRWVIPGKLGGVRKATADELPALQASGIGAIVSVMDDHVLAFLIKFSNKS
jgi:hypothetical protein